MSIQIGKNYLDNLIRIRALVRQAIGRHKPQDFDMHILKKEDIVAVVYPYCGNCTCYECGERIYNGLQIKIFTNTKNRKLKITRYHFHYYHF